MPLRDGAVNIDAVLSTMLDNVRLGRALKGPVLNQCKHDCETSCDDLFTMIDTITER